MLRSDLNRYKKTSGSIDFSEPSIIIVILYRFGQLIKRLRFKPLKIFLNIFHVPIYAFFSLITGIHLARGCKIGKGLRIYHFGCIIINSGVVIGDNCTIRHEVTIGNRKELYDLPIIGNNVNIGAGAKILGNIRIGNNVNIGANSVVITDIPDNSNAAGVPAKILKK